MSRMIQIPVDASFSTRMKQLNEDLDRSGEEIVAQNKIEVEGQTVMVVSIREGKEKKKNILLGQVNRGQRILND